MDAAYLSAFAALAGSAIGGMTSLAASWLSQNVQARTQQLAADKASRQELYKGFMQEASRLYAQALVTDKGELADLVNLYAMLSEIRVVSSRVVVDTAEAAVDRIIATYFEPNMTLSDLKEHLHDSPMDPLRAFGEACREDLRRLSRGYARRSA